MLAAADRLVGVELADADELAARLQADGLTRDVVPAAGLQRLIALWDVPVPDPPRLIDVSGRSILIGPSGQARLGELRGDVVEACRLDDTLVAELRRHRERPVTTAELRQALVAAGYTAAAAAALVYMSPIPHRVPGGPGFYQLRGVSVWRA